MKKMRTFSEFWSQFINRSPMATDLQRILMSNMHQYAVRDYSKPMGVATYSTFADMPTALQKALPDVE